MENIYDILTVGLMAALSLTGFAFLIAGTVRYRTDPVWWILSLILFGMGGYAAYFASKRKYLVKNGMPAGAIKSAGMKSWLSIAYLIAAWVAILTICTVVIMRARHAGLELSSAYIFWGLFAVSAAFFVCIALPLWGKCAE